MLQLIKSFFAFIQSFFAKPEFKLYDSAGSFVKNIDKPTLSEATSGNVRFLWPSEKRERHIAEARTKFGKHFIRRHYAR